MQQVTKTFALDTRGPGLVEITGQIVAWCTEQAIGEGLLTLFCRHTSASLLINENAARAVRGDIERYFARLAPEDPPRLRA